WAFTFTLIPMAAVTLLRSRHPIIALGLGTIILVIDVSLGASPGVVLLYLDVVYAAVKYGSSRALRFLFPFALILFVIAVTGCSRRHFDLMGLECSQRTSTNPGCYGCRAC